MLVRRLSLGIASSRPSRCLFGRASRTCMAFRPQSGCSSPLSPRKFPSSGYEVIDSSQKVEEEKLPHYEANAYYPVRIAEVIHCRYQVVAKLGYGTSSTVWLCHDLRNRSYWALKVHVNILRHNQELQVYQHLERATATLEHPGREHVRKLENSFNLDGPHGKHDVFVMVPLGMSLRSLHEKQDTGVFGEILAVIAIDQVLLGLEFLHLADVIHTDIHADNLLIAITDESVLSDVEEQEINEPSARKQAGNRAIYVSRYMLGGAGPLTICDLGQARIGTSHRGTAMPLQYRAPEVILDMDWGQSVDMWSVGLLAWNFLERESLFHIYNQNSQAQNDASHLAAMVALLGPPPAEFLNRSEKTLQYWNKDGGWIGPVPIPTERRLEDLSRTLKGERKAQFFDFIRSLLCWLPEDRLSAGDAWHHPWVAERSKAS